MCQPMIASVLKLTKLHAKTLQHGRGGRPGIKYKGKRVDAMDTPKECMDTDCVAISATMQFETDAGKPLNVFIFVDRTSTKRDLYIAQFECGSVFYEHIVGSTETLSIFDETWPVQQMLDVARDCSRRDHSWDCVYTRFKLSGIQIGEEIISERTIQYGFNKEWKWPDLPRKYKELFEASAGAA